MMVIRVDIIVNNFYIYNKYFGYWKNKIILYFIYIFNVYKIEFLVKIVIILFDYN